MPSGQDYANRLHEEVHRTFAPHISSMQEAIQSLHDHFMTSLGQLSPKLEAIRSVESHSVANILTEALAEAHRQKQEETAFLADFTENLRRKETQEEMLTLLLDAAHRHAPNVVLFVVRGDQVSAWSARGYSDTAAEKLCAASFAKSESPALQQALDADSTFSITDLSLETRLGEILPASDPGGAWHFFPMRAIERPIAVLMASGTAEHHCDLVSLRILMDFTTLRIENIAIKILQEMKALEAAGALPQVAHEPVSAMETHPAQTAAPTTIAEETIPEPEVSMEATAATLLPAAAPDETREEVVRELAEPEEPHPPQDLEAPAVVSGSPAPEAAVSPEPAPEQVEPAPVPEAAASPEPVPEQVEPAPVPEAAAQESLEALPVSEPAPAEAEVSIGVEVEAPETVPAIEIQRLAEEERLHADARRFARLLVSEIKLYNEQRLLEGRERKDIYVRLKRDIDRSREMYQKRVPPSVARKADYFDEEIVRILAENDLSKLGSDYPGPRIES